MFRGWGQAPRWAVAVMVAGSVAVAVLAILFVTRPQARPSEDGAAGAAASADIGDAPRVVFVGDSWTYGVGATDFRSFYTVVTAKQLGWDLTSFGIGGSGYTVTGPVTAATTYAERVPQAIDAGGDVIVVQGSLNDRLSSPGDIQRAALQTFQDLRASAPEPTAILAVGSSYTPGTDRRDIDKVNAAIGLAAEQVGIRFVNPAAESWNDPSDPLIWSDATHPNDAGHQRLAEHLAPLLAELVAGLPGSQ